ncbi:unnamed protein product [Pleuronectes platessa]|uniref:Uncharacterized protein n=1 Tax=Pleuronectes platessa TaxID=8262 RepID=A0A9N7YSK1_PLEPL|nr:unnamed protein product [Pleuronectes platessa]
MPTTNMAAVAEFCKHTARHVFSIVEVSSSCPTVIGTIDYTAPHPINYRWHCSISVCPYPIRHKPDYRSRVLQDRPPLGPGAPVIAFLYLLSSGNKAAHCVHTDSGESGEASGSHTAGPDGVGHTGSLPFSAIISGPSPNCGELAGARPAEAGGLERGLY